MNIMGHESWGWDESRRMESNERQERSVSCSGRNGTDDLKVVLGCMKMQKKKDMQEVAYTESLGLG